MPSSNSTTTVEFAFTNFYGLTPENQTIAQRLRDNYLSLRDQADDFDGRDAVTAARATYYLLALAAALVARPVSPKAAASVERARAKAEYHLAGGLRVRRATNGSYLVPSATHPGAVVHRVSDGVCSCEASQNGRYCWHLEAVTLTVALPARAA